MRPCMGRNLNRKLGAPCHTNEACLFPAPALLFMAISPHSLLITAVLQTSCSGVLITWVLWITFFTD
uniref:Uncharacterized protein n=1 Tax=Anguilla anguilla TaxID=7936 RepID=A0A0E9TCZ2_ANGAN